MTPAKDAVLLARKLQDKVQSGPVARHLLMVCLLNGLGGCKNINIEGAENICLS